MFGCVKNSILLVSEIENNQPCLIKVKITDDNKENITKIIKENAELSDFFSYLPKCSQSVSDALTPQNGTRIVVSTDKYIKNIVLYHNNLVMKTVSQGETETRFIATGDLIGSKKLTSLNNFPIKKICSIDGVFKIGILTECGKLFMMDNFDSDEKYDLTNLQVVLSDNEKVIDINCTYNSIIFLTENGDVFRIKQIFTDGKYSVNAPVKISGEIGPVAEIGCHNFRTIMRTYNGEFYSDKTDPNAEDPENFFKVYGYSKNLNPYFIEDDQEEEFDDQEEEFDEEQEYDDQEQEYDDQEQEYNDNDNVISYRVISYNYQVVRLNAFNNINIVKFDCSNYHTVVLDDNGNLYTHAINKYGVTADAKLTKLDIDLYKFPNKTKSARY